MMERSLLVDVYGPSLRKILKARSLPYKAREVLGEAIIKDMRQTLEVLCIDTEDQDKVELVCRFTIWEWLQSEGGIE